MSGTRLLQVPGVPESALPPQVLAQLPAATPAPPWRCSVRALLWVQRTRTPLPEGVRVDGRPLPLTVGAFVDYRTSPVGGYREVLAGPLLRRAGWPTAHVPFLAVDSLPSVHGGRAHWDLPKVLAFFEGEPEAGTISATGDGWSVRAHATSAGPELPLAGIVVASQGRGPARAVLRGRGRFARVRVEARGPSLGTWLGSRSAPGLLVRGRLVVHPPAGEEPG